MNETNAYRQLFHAAREQTKVEIPLDSMRSAHRLRYQLNAFRKKARERNDRDLATLEQISITIEVREERPYLIAKVRDLELVTAVQEALPTTPHTRPAGGSVQQVDDLAELLQQTITDDPYFSGGRQR